MQQKTVKPTIQELRGRQDIPEEDRRRIEELALRLIQIQDETKRLEAERGYTEPGGKRRPGIADELEGLYIKWDIPGVRWEDYQVLPSHGSNQRIDKNLLLAAGVLPEDINAATVTSNWTGVQVRRDRERE